MREIVCAKLHPYGGEAALRASRAAASTPWAFGVAKSDILSPVASVAIGLPLVWNAQGTVPHAVISEIRVEDMRRRSARQQSWDQFGLPQAGRAALTHFNKHVRPFLPRCDAKRKSDGEPCQNITAKGRSKCRVHGGATPAGDDWHRLQWPNGNAPDWQARLNAKLKRAERDQRQKERRLAKMSPEERQRHEKWQRDHKPGRVAERARKREDRKRAAEVRDSLAIVEPKPVSPEIAALQAQAAYLEAERDRYRAMAQAEQHQTAGNGVFD